MAKMSAQEFVKKAAEDAAFRKQLGVEDGMTLSQFQALAAAAGFDYPEAELANAAKELSDADLDRAAGGAETVHLRARSTAPAMLGGSLRIPGGTLSGIRM